MNNTDYKNIRFPNAITTSRPVRSKLSLFGRARLPDSHAARIARAAAIEVLG